MSEINKNTIKIYCDASFDNVNAGLGYIIRTHKDIIIRSSYVKNIRTSHDAEITAASNSLMQALTLTQRNSHVMLYTDSLTIVNLNSSYPTKISEKNIHYKETLKKAISFAKEEIAKIDINHIKGHGKHDNFRNDNSWLHGVCDCLANLGRNGENIRVTIPNTENFKEALQEVHWKLNPIEESKRKRSYTIEETSYELGIDKKYVLQMIDERHLPFNENTLRVPIYAIKEVKEMMKKISSNMNTNKELAYAP